MAASKLLAGKVELPGFPAEDIEGREGDDVEWPRKTEVRRDSVFNLSVHMLAMLFPQQGMVWLIWQSFQSHVVPRGKSGSLLQNVVTDWAGREGGV